MAEPGDGRRKKELRRGKEALGHRAYKKRSVSNTRAWQTVYRLIKLNVEEKKTRDQREAACLKKEGV